MISLDKAKALKEAGLEWEPKEGDWFVLGWDDSREIRLCTEGYSEKYFGDAKEDIWLPRLDQLLAEVEKRGWRWDIQAIFPLHNPPKIYRCEIWGIQKFILRDAETTEDAAAEAVLWIIRQKAAGTEEPEKNCQNCRLHRKNSNSPEYCPGLQGVVECRLHK